jgi:hypothetical protein
MPPRAAAPPPGPAAVVLPRTRTPGSGPPATGFGQAVTDREACRPTPSTHQEAKRNARSQASLLRDMADTSVHPPFRHRDVLFSPPTANSNHWKEDEQHRTSTSCSNPDRVRLRREKAPPRDLALVISPDARAPGIHVQSVRQPSREAQRRPPRLIVSVYLRVQTGHNQTGDIPALPYLTCPFWARHI